MVGIYLLCVCCPHTARMRAKNHSYHLTRETVTFPAKNSHRGSRLEHSFPPVTRAWPLLLHLGLATRVNYRVWSTLRLLSRNPCTMILLSGHPEIYELHLDDSESIYILFCRMTDGSSFEKIVPLSEGATSHGHALSPQDTVHTTPDDELAGRERSSPGGGIRGVRNILSRHTVVLKVVGTKIQQNMYRRAMFCREGRRHRV